MASTTGFEPVSYSSNLYRTTKGEVKMLENSQLDSKVDYSKTNLYKQTGKFGKDVFDSHLPHRIWNNSCLHSHSRYKGK